MNALSRFLLLALLGCLLGAPATAQALVFKGGPSLLASRAPLNNDGSDVAPNVQLGARTWLTDLFQAQATLGYTEGLTAEGALQLRPFGRDRTWEPYAFIGYGVLFGEEARRTVFPAGIGVERHLKNSMGLFFELAGRWQSDRNPVANVNNLDFYISPTVGLAYEFNPPQRPDFYVRGDRDSWVPPPDEPSEPVAATSGSEEASRTERQAAYPQGMRVEPIAVVQDAWARWGQPSNDVKDLGDKVQIPDGTYIMGLTDEDPLLLQTAGLKRVTISSFVIDKHEVSNADYKAYLDSFGGSEGSAMRPDPTAWERAGSASTMQSYFMSPAYDEFPVVAITWQQAADYCAYAGGRLPTEAEWEYAARSGLAGGIYPWPGLEPRNPEGAYLANYSPGRAVYAADGYAFTAPVDAFYPTPWGLYNMSGNVAEWVQDSYSASYSALSNFNPMHLDPGEPRRIVRGGSWASDDFYIGVGVRDAQPASEASIFTGFRCAYGLDVTMGVADAQGEADVQDETASEQVAIDTDDTN